MFRNYFKTTLRNLTRNKLYAAINITGLAVGITACLLIGVYIMQELSYDKFNTNANRIVRVTMQYGEAGTVNNVASTGTKVGPQFKRVFPSVESYARTFITSRSIKTSDKMFEEPRVLYADSSFLDIFSFRIIEGNKSAALNASDKIVLTQSAAKKYFGNNDAINKTISIGDKDYIVSAVCEDAPQASQLKFDFITQFANLGNNVKTETWWTANWITYCLVKNANDIPALQQQVNTYMSSAAVKTDAGLEGNAFLKYNLEPLLKIHLYSSLAGFEPNGSISNIYMLAIIALLIIIIACANYTNLATAQSTARTGEIGMRKVMGASKRQVFMQFIGESFFTTLIAAVLALLLAIILIPYFNNLTGKHFTADVLLQPLPLTELIICIITVSFLAGLYPALILSGARIMNILKKGFSFTGNGNVLRKILIVAQFAISIFLIIYTVIVLQQMHYMQTKNLGYDKEHLLVLPISGKMFDDMENLKAAFVRVKSVESITASYETPEDIEWGDGITATDEKGTHEISVNALPVDLDFIKTMKMQLVTGRDFQRSDFALMDTANNAADYRSSYIINEALASKIGWTPQQSINRQMTKGEAGNIVGVVKNFNFTSLHNPIEPLVIFLNKDLCRDFILRINGNTTQTLTALENVWKQRVPYRPFSYHFVDEDYNKLYQAEQRTSLLFSVASSLAILLALFGLFGLAAFTTVQRTKEIGIRRILGANIGNITLLVSKNFLQLVAIAIVIAVPLAWLAGKNWLQDFSFRIQVQPYVFFITAAATMLIALATVSYHSIKASLTKPVKSLRSE